jgi:arsenate reductase-like glutaredoxin family protein
LYKKYLNNKSADLLEKYKRYKNKLISILRFAEKNYFSNKLLEAKNNLSKTWRVINNITNRTTSTKSINEIVVSDQIIDDPMVIANKFNNFFVNVGLDLAKKISPGNKSPIDFLEGNYINSIFLNPTTDEEIEDIIDNMKNSKSTGLDNIPIKIIKFCKHELSSILSHINNQSLLDSIFPDELKIAKVVPIFKAGDAKQVSNYRLGCIKKSFFLQISSNSI